MSNAGRYYMGVVALSVGSYLIDGHGHGWSLVGCVVIASTYFWAFFYGRRA